MLTSIFAQSDQFSSGARGLILSKYIENPDQPAIFAAPVDLSFRFSFIYTIQTFNHKQKTVGLSFCLMGNFACFFVVC